MQGTCSNCKYWHCNQPDFDSSTDPEWEDIKTTKRYRAMCHHEKVSVEHHENWRDTLCASGFKDDVPPGMTPTVLTGPDFGCIHFTGLLKG